MGQMAGGMPQAVTVTPEERQAIERVSLTSLLYDALMVRHYFLAKAN